MNAKSQSRRLVITGANSYLGQKTLAHLMKTTDWSVTGVVSPRFDSNACIAASGNVRYLVEDLTQPASSELQDALQAADAVVHFAWLRNADPDVATRQNIAVLDRLLEHRASKATFVFITSVAASPTALSSYGQAKFATGQHATSRKCVSLSCGLVCAAEPHGPYKQLVSAVRKYPFTILPIGPAPRVYPVWLDDVVEGVRSVCQQCPEAGIYRLWGSRVPVHKFMRNMCDQNRMLRVPVPAPFFLLSPIVSSLLFLGVLRPSIADQLKTFLYKDDVYLASLQQVPGLRLGAVDSVPTH